MWTQRMAHLRDKHFFNPSRILDIGACIGHFHDLARDIWPNSEIVMIEANSNCESELIKRKSKYHIKALSNEYGKRTFYKNNQSISSGESFYRENTDFFSGSLVKEEEVQTYTLDQLFKDDVFDLIKMDTQGSEIDILNGGPKLRSKAYYILIEASVTSYNIGAPMLKDVLNDLDSMGFSMVDIWNCAYANRVKGKHFDDLCQVDVLFENTNLVK
jgi:FkbM family methyltransferase